VIDFAQALPSLTTVSPYDAFLQALRITYGIDTDQVLEVIGAQYGDLEAQPLQLHTWSWGYTHWHNGEYIPDALYLTYEFEFTPNAQADYSAAKYPPRRVRVDGQIDKTCQ